MSTGQLVRLGKITWLATKIKTGVVAANTTSNNPLILDSLFLQKNASPVASHPIKVDKCGGEIAKLATSSEPQEGN